MSNPQPLIVNNVRSEHSRRSLMYSGVKCWNAVPIEIRQSPTYICFKLKLKKYLLNMQLISTKSVDYLSYHR